MPRILKIIAWIAAAVLIVGLVLFFVTRQSMSASFPNVAGAGVLMFLEGVWQFAALVLFVIGIVYLFKKFSVQRVNLKSKSRKLPGPDWLWLVVVVFLIVSVFRILFNMLFASVID